MSLLSDFFIATPNEVQDADIAQTPVGRFPGLLAKRTDVIKIVQLQCIVEGSLFDDHVAGLDALFVRTMSDEGTWIVRVPDSLFEFLYSAEANRIRTVGKQWAETEEWRLDRGSPDDIILFLDQICQLARMAKSAGKELYVWISL